MDSGVSPDASAMYGEVILHRTDYKSGIEELQKPYGIAARSSRPWAESELPGLPSSPRGTGKGLGQTHPFCCEWPGNLQRGVRWVPTLRNHQTKIEGWTVDAIASAEVAPGPQDTWRAAQLHA